MRASEIYIDGNDVCSADQIHLDQPFERQLGTLLAEHAEQRAMVS